MMRIKNLRAIVGAAALALIVAGCGSSSDREEEPMSTAEETALEMAKTTLTSAQAAVVALSEDPTEEELRTHEMQQNAVKTAAEDVVAALQAADPTVSYTDVSMYQDIADKAGTAADTAGASAKTIADAETKRLSELGAVTTAKTGVDDAQAMVAAATNVEDRAVAQDDLVAKALVWVGAITAQEDAAEDALEAAEGVHTAAVTARAATQTLQTAMMTLSEADDAVPDGYLEEQLESLQAVADAAQVVVDALVDAMSTAAEDAAAAMDLGDANMEIMDANTEIAKVIAGALNADLMDAPPFDGVTDHTENYEVTVEAEVNRPDHGDVPPAVPPATIGAVDYEFMKTVGVEDPETKTPNVPSELPNVTDDNPALEIDGLMGFRFSRTHDEDGNKDERRRPRDETVVLYTDLDKPQDVSFDTRYSAHREDAVGADVGTDILVNIMSKAHVGLATPITGDGDLYLNNHPDKIVSDGNDFEATGVRNAMKTFEPVDDVDSDDYGYHMLPGSFEGARGVYRCGTGGPAVSGECVVTFDSDGNLLEFPATTPPTSPHPGALSDDWVFIPDTGASVVLEDGDYLWFGYWLESVEAGGDTYAYTFQAFSGGSTRFVPDSPIGYDSTGGGTITGRSAVVYGGRMAAVEGSADYDGNAGGMYMKKVLSSDGREVVSATHGEFTATANLTANFGGAEVAASQQFTINGTVTDFMDGDTAIDENWSVMLGDAELGDASFKAPPPAAGVAGSTPELRTHFSTFSGLTEGDASANAGRWRGAFYGSSAPVDVHEVAGETDGIIGRGQTVDGVIYPLEIPQPTGVAGEFNAHFTNGHVHGAFGAAGPENIKAPSDWEREPN